MRLCRRNGCGGLRPEARRQRIDAQKPAGDPESGVLARGSCSCAQAPRGGTEAVHNRARRRLNHLVTEELVSHGIPAVGISPFGTWKTSCKNVIQAGFDTVKDVLDSGYVPVLHGDCALDSEQHCCILSGDKIIEVLAKKFSPRRVVFLTDVSGIYSCPPDTPGARLVDSIVVGPDGNMEPPVLSSILPHDTTGGVSLKLQTAVNIVSQSHGTIPVLICKLDSEAAERACLTGELEQGEGTTFSFAES
uniref:isopentenyl phosphate kinase-like isoform X3 n=1 Tax=Podarcis muralis TaxID=64176 RepID=UPI00109F33FF|nr:isopentenyl phosphate kinase-like isoform X3 [Podarcis muralis]